MLAYKACSSSVVGLISSADELAEGSFAVVGRGGTTVAGVLLPLADDDEADGGRYTLGRGAACVGDSADGATGAEVGVAVDAGVDVGAVASAAAGGPDASEEDPVTTLPLFAGSTASVSAIFGDLRNWGSIVVNLEIDSNDVLYRLPPLRTDAAICRAIVASEWRNAVRVLT